MQQQQARPATAADVAAHAQQQDIVKIVSSHGGREYELNKHAAAQSQVLRNMLEVVERDNDPIEFDFADNQIAFVAAVLTYLSRTSLESQTKEQLAEIIMGIGRQFGLSFVDMLHLVHFFDIPVAFNAITSIQPLPLPRTPAAAGEYNALLTIVFDMAISTASPSRPSDDLVADAPLHQQRLDRIGSVQLWQLFGRMLYPDCMRYAEVQRMFDGIKACFDANVAKLLLHEIMLGEYMQQHPELYSHPLKNIAEGIGYINSIAFGVNNQTIVSGSADNKIRVWNVQMGTSTTLALNTCPSLVIAFSPDYQKVASASDFYPSDMQIRLWNVESRSLIQTFTGHTASIYSIVFSPDGRTIVSGGADETLRLWDVQTGEEKISIKAGYVYSVAFSPDGTKIATGSDDGIVRLWNAADGSLIRMFAEHNKRAIYSIVFSPDGKSIASGSLDHTARLLNVQTGVSIVFAKHAESVKSVAFSPNGQIVVSGSSNGEIKLWDVRMSISKALVENGGGVHSLAFSPDSTMIASGENGGRIRLLGYMSLFEALQSPLAASSYKYARKKIAAAVQPPTTARAAVATSKPVSVQPKPLFMPGFLEKAFADTARRAAEAQEINDDDEPVILPAPLPGRKK
jgi:WD40 repeat protein